MSVSHTTSVAGAVKSRCARSSCTAAGRAACPHYDGLSSWSSTRPEPASRAAHPPLAGQVAERVEFIGDEPVAELGVVAVHVDNRVREVRVGPVAIGARPRALLVERLRREFQHPARQPHRHPFGGELTDEREHHFGSVSIAKYAACTISDCSALDAHRGGRHRCRPGGPGAAPLRRDRNRRRRP